MNISLEEFYGIHHQVDEVLNWKRWIRELEELMLQNSQFCDDSQFVSLVNDIKSQYKAKIDQLFKFFEVNQLEELK